MAVAASSSSSHSLSDGMSSDGIPPLEKAVRTKLEVFRWAQADFRSATPDAFASVNVAAGWVPRRGGEGKDRIEKGYPHDIPQLVE